MRLKPIKSELALSILLSATFGTVMLDRMVQLFLGPELVTAFHLTPGQVGMLAGSLSIGWAVSTSVFGLLSDRIGRKKVLVPAIVAFSLMSFLSGYAQTFSQLLIIRALLGLCEGPCWSVVMALMADQSSDRHRGRNLGIVNCSGSLVGSAIAPIFATQMAAAAGWQWAFFAAGIPGLILAVVIALYVPEPVARVRPEESSGGFRTLIRVRGLWLCFFGASCFTTFVISFSAFGPLYLSGPAGLSSTTAGFVMAASGLGGFLYSLIGPALSDRIGRRLTLSIAAGLTALLPMMFLLGSGHWPSGITAIIAFFITAAPAIAALMLVVLPVEFAPKGSSAAAVGFVAIGAELLGATIGPVLAGASADHYGLAAPMVLCTVTSLLVLLFALLLSNVRKGASANAPVANLYNPAERHR